MCAYVCRSISSWNSFIFSKLDIASRCRSIPRMQELFDNQPVCRVKILVQVDLDRSLNCAFDVALMTLLLVYFV